MEEIYQHHFANKYKVTVILIIITKTVYSAARASCVLYNIMLIILIYETWL